MDESGMGANCYCDGEELLGCFFSLTKKVHLRIVGLGKVVVWSAGIFGLGVGFFCVRFLRVEFEVAEDFGGAGDDGLGEAREASDLNTVAFVGRTRLDFAEEDDVFVPLADGDVVVLDRFFTGGEVAEFVIVGGEEGAGLGGVVEMLGDGPGDGESVEGGGAAPNFIENDQGVSSGIVDDECGFVHFYHEGGLTL